MGGNSSDPNIPIVVRAKSIFDESYRIWINLSSLPMEQKNKYQIKFSDKLPAYQLIDINGNIIADSLNVCRRRAVFVPLIL